ncbi:AzlC family ABC transporter permease [soil metagenome]
MAGEDRKLVWQAATVALAVSAFGLSFGVLTAEAGLSLAQAVALSALVFSGSAQFAAVSIVADGGTGVSAVVSGLLLNVRSLAFGVVLAPVLDGPLRRRLFASQLVIDESTALAVAQPDDDRRRRAFWLTGGAVFVGWNVSTVVGAVLTGALGDRIDPLGLDAAIPAAFLALLAPRLGTGPERLAAVIGTAVALALVPVAPAGVPILAASVGAVVALRLGPQGQEAPT